MFCEKCGKSINKDDKFCQHCGLKIGSEVEKIHDQPKYISKFTLVALGVIFFAFLVFWVYKFGFFNPQKGTSGASISALWGQFFVSFLAVAILDLIILFIDFKRKVKVFKLASFWLLIVILLAISTYFIVHRVQDIKEKNKPKTTNFNFKSAPSNFTLITLGEYQCQNVNSCWVNLPIQGLTEKGATIKMTEPAEQDIKVLDNGTIRDMVWMRMKLGVNYFTFKVKYSDGKEENIYKDSTMKMD